MAKSIPVKLGEFRFGSRADAYAAVRAMIARSNDGQRLHGRDAKLAGVVFEHHPDRRTKAPHGVDHFKVDKAPFGTRCLHVVGKDGRSCDFSFERAITGRRRVH